MCGIAGIFGQSYPDSARLHRALAKLSQRGPDGTGVRLFDNKEAFNGALIHTRLSIRDLSVNGAQPMSNEDGSLWIVYNGECYGWEGDREYLESRGHRFRSGTDTEFILHGYEEWGRQVLERLRGMFAFAILDMRRGRLFCARDRLGKKPFYFTAKNGMFCFASTIGALRELMPEKPRLDPQGIDAYLAHRYVPSPLSIFEGVEKLPPAHFLIVDLENLRALQATEYWSPEPVVTNLVEDLLRESLRLRLVSDRPVGLFLSGGIDSHALASLLANNPDVSAFTASFDDSRFDEAAEASAIASSVGLKHSILPIKIKNDDIEAIVGDLDEPFADPSAIATWYLCREATQHVKVALSGDGGDELFAGYKRYQKHLASKKFGWLRPLGLILPRQSGWIDKRNFFGRLARIRLQANLSWSDSYVLRFSGVDPITRAYLQPALKVLPLHHWRLPAFAATRDPLEWMLECDRLNYLPDYILKKGDLCGMAHGLELRSPYLDHKFFQSVIGMRREERFTNPPKALLRRISSRAEAGPKRGFNPPLDAWIASPRIRDWITELPQTLERLTGGQIEGVRLSRVLAEGNGVSSEWLWQLVLLQISLSKLTK